MTLAHPLLLLLLLLAVPLVLAFLRRPPPTRQVVSSLLLARALSSARARRRRPPLRELICLALMLLALLLSVLGLSTQPDPPPRGLLVLLDTSAASEHRRSTDLAILEAALTEIPAATVTLLSTAPPRVVHAHSTDRATLLGAAASLPSRGTDGPLDSLLATYCTGERPPLLLALMDDVPDLALDDAGCPLWAPASPPMNNTGLTELAVRRADGLGLVEVHLATEPAASVLLSADGTPVGLVSVDGPTLTRLDLPGARQLTAAVQDGGDWPGDDAATADIPEPAQVRALLVTNAPDGFAAAALQAHPGVTLTVSADVPADPGTWDLAVIESEVSTLPRTHHLILLGTDPTQVGVQAGPTVQRPAVSIENPTSPLMQYVSVDNLVIDRAHTLSLPDGGAVLLSSPQGPLAIQGDLPSGAVLVFGFPLHATDLVLRTGFINLMANAIEWARPSPPVGIQGAGVLSFTESTATPLDVRDDRVPAQLPLSSTLAAVIVFVLLSVEWCLQWAWRRAS